MPFDQTAQFSQTHYFLSRKLASAFVARCLKAKLFSCSFEQADHRLAMLSLLGKWRLAVEEMRSEEDLGFKNVAIRIRPHLGGLLQPTLNKDTAYFCFSSPMLDSLIARIYWLTEEEIRNKEQNRFLPQERAIYIEKKETAGTTYYEVEYFSKLSNEHVQQKFTVSEMESRALKNGGTINNFSRPSEEDKEQLELLARRMLLERLPKEIYAFATSHATPIIYFNPLTEGEHLDFLKLCPPSVWQDMGETVLPLPENASLKYHVRQKSPDVLLFGTKNSTSLVTPCSTGNYASYFSMFAKRHLQENSKTLASLRVSQKDEDSSKKIEACEAQIYGFILDHKIALTNYKKNDEGDHPSLPQNTMIWQHTDYSSNKYDKSLRIQAFLDVLIEDFTQIDYVHAPAELKQPLLEELLEKAAIIHWWWSHAILFQRGSAAIGEVVMMGLFEYHQLEVIFNGMPDCVALTCAAPEAFIKEYQIGACIKDIQPILKQSPDCQASTMEEKMESSALLQSFCSGLQLVCPERAQKKEVVDALTAMSQPSSDPQECSLFMQFREEIETLHQEADGYKKLTTFPTNSENLPLEEEESKAENFALKFFEQQCKDATKGFQAYCDGLLQGLTT